ncbi:hypothetical protein X766_15825 [Mesorhizobium sp. LSJC255A00]|nr:hypothetical protein [Mesorhizobium sp. LSJC255A00]ESX17869.1 hypothetical protein X766_15825 [Mesorhizobium sp. LSJC255A00]
MADGRVYVSSDNWLTIYLLKPDGKRRKVTGHQADIIRLVHVMGGSTWSS